MPRLPGIEQNSPSWLKLRRGMITASRVGDLMDKNRNGKWSAKRTAYWEEKLAEIMTVPSYAANHKVTEDMLWGTECQPLARSAWEAERGIFCEAGGFWIHNQISQFAASPDYLVPPDGLVEIKCRRPENHLPMVRKIRAFGNKEIPEEYELQMQAQMAITGAKWCDFVAFDPRVEPAGRLLITRVERNQPLIQAIEFEVRQFIKELDEEITKLRKDN